MIIYNRDNIRRLRPSFFYAMNYKSKRWRRLRESALARDGYLCMENKRYGRRVPAEVVHHIFPAEEYPELEYKLYNLLSLSKEAHNRMHDRDSHEITEAGRYWQEKIIKKYRPPLES